MVLSQRFVPAFTLLFLLSTLVLVQKVMSGGCHFDNRALFECTVKCWDVCKDEVGFVSAFCSEGICFCRTCT